MPRSSPSRRSAPRGQVRIIGGHLKRSRLEVALSPGLRPTPDRVRETLFNWLGQQLDGWVCVDLFAGSGALGFEAASRGAARVDLVERDPTLARLLQANASRLGATAIIVHAQDALAFAAAQAPAGYDLAFIDPPYAATALYPAALDAAARLLRPGALAYLETPNTALQAQLADVPAWELLRSDRAGAVHYALLRRREAAQPVD